MGDGFGSFFSSVADLVSEKKNIIFQIQIQILIRKVFPQIRSCVRILTLLCFFSKVGPFKLLQTGGTRILSSENIWSTKYGTYPSKPTLDRDQNETSQIQIKTSQICHTTVLQRMGPLMTKRFLFFLFNKLLFLPWFLISA